MNRRKYDRFEADLFVGLANNGGFYLNYLDGRRPNLCRNATDIAGYVVEELNGKSLDLGFDPRVKNGLIKQVKSRLKKKGRMDEVRIV